VAAGHPSRKRRAYRDLVGGRRQPARGRLGSDRRLRLVAATTDPASLPGHSSWYLLTTFPDLPAAVPSRPIWPAAAASQPLHLLPPTIINKLPLALAVQEALVWRLGGVVGVG
jgi:hypothetical protein